VADDPGSDPAPRPKRRRRSKAKAGLESPPVAPVEAAADASTLAEPDLAAAPSDIVEAPIRIVEPVDNAFPIAFAYPLAADAEPIDDAAPLAADAEPIDDAAPLAADAEPIDDAAPLDQTPLPTFVYVTPGAGAAPDAVEPASASAVADVPPPAPKSVDHGWLPVLDDRSPDPEICPFLRAVDESDRMVAPVEAPDAANRCAALRDAVPQSLRQQELVCLASGHVNCPRYLRGAVVMAEAPAPVARPARTLTPAILGSLLVLVLAASASVAFVLAGGGLQLAVVPTASPVPSATNVAVAPATPTPTPTVTATASPSPSPSPTPSPTPTPVPTPTPTPEPTARPAATSDRYALLRACPDTPDCWIYRVRSGDNLYSIANYFGVSQDSIYRRNPWTRTQGLRAGQELRLPPPTR
jgi:hypothetical protein